MPHAEISLIQALIPIVEKLGVAGVLCFACWYLWAENRRLKRDLAKVYRLRDKWRTGFTILKVAADGANLKVDLSPMTMLEGDDEDDK